jgi:hypothetical protein
MTTKYTPVVYCAFSTLYFTMILEASVQAVEKARLMSHSVVQFMGVSSCGALGGILFMWDKRVVGDFTLAVILLG